MGYVCDRTLGPPKSPVRIADAVRCKLMGADVVMWPHLTSYFDCFLRMDEGD